MDNGVIFLWLHHAGKSMESQFGHQMIVIWLLLCHTERYVTMVWLFVR